MFQVAQPTVDEEWPELGKVCTQVEKVPAKAHAKPPKKRNWKLFEDEIPLSKQPGSANGANSSSSRKESRSDKSSRHVSPAEASQNRRLAEINNGCQRKSSGHFSESNGFVCLSVRPDFAGVEMPVTMPRPGFSMILFV